jgi:hypothetical protein
LKKHVLKSRTELEQIKEVETIFMKKVIQDEGALITDGSYLFDFIPLNDISRAVGKGSQPHLYKFRLNLIKIDPVTQQKTIEPKEWDSEGEDTIPKFKKRAIDVFGVDIGPVFEKPIYQILLFIIKNYKSSSSV